MKDSGPRINERIRISPVRVIMDGNNLGIMSANQALFLAQERGLDLVEVSPNIRPPVCKIMDFGKWKYEQAISDKEKRQKQRANQLKEMRFRPSIGEHDAHTKIRAIVEFLESGQRVQVKIVFQRRENAHKDLGFKLIHDIIDKTNQYGHPQNAPRIDGRDIVCILEPGEKR